MREKSIGTSLTWEQNPTQYHIVNALADLPVLAYLPAMVTTGSTNLFVPDRMPRVLDDKETLPAKRPGRSRFQDH